MRARRRPDPGPDADQTDAHAPRPRRAGARDPRAVKPADSEFKIRWMVVGIVCGIQKE